MMTAAEIRLKQNPILTNLLLGLGQGSFIAESLFPRLPQSLSAVTLAQAGDERLRRYNLRRAPGGATKRVDIRYDGKTYTVNQYSVEVPIPRELIREADESRKLNVGNYLDISRIAMATANDILLLDYELEVASLATAAGSYAAGHVLALAGGTKWSASTGTPVTDIRAASEVIRKKIGKRPNTLTLSADAGVVTNLEQMFNKANSLSVLSKNIGKDGFVANGSGGRLTYGGQLNIPEGYYFDAEAANKDPRFQQGMTDGSEFIKPKPQSATSTAAARAASTSAMQANPRNYGNAGYSVFGEAAYRPAAAAPAPTSTPAPVSTSHVVTINLNGVSTPINTASEDDSRRLAAWLQELSNAAGRAA